MGEPPGSSNLELIGRAFDAYSRGDRARLIALVHPEAEIVPLAPDLTSTDGPFHGRAGAELWLDRLGELRREFEGEPEELHEAEDLILVIGKVRTRNPGSGFGFTQRVGWVIRIEDEMIRSFRGYPDPAAAIRAAGLTP